MYSEACVKHLERSHSNHCPIVPSLRNNTRCQFPRPFRFQLMWLSHPTFSEVVKDAWANHSTLPIAIASFTSKAQVWNKNQFGNIFHRKKRICARLRGIQIALGKPK